MLSYHSTYRVSLKDFESSRIVRFDINNFVSASVVAFEGKKKKKKDFVLACLP